MRLLSIWLLGLLLAGETCSSRGYYSGTLACSGDCRSFDESYCVTP